MAVLGLRYPPLMVAAGETQHLRGIEGVRRARRWLGYSTRIRTLYDNTDKLFGDLLAFSWPHGGKTFTFDIGGKFRGGTLEDVSFMGEIKNYDKEGDLAQRFGHFVACSYVALQHKPDRCNTLLWISWSPFQAKGWDRHRSVESLRKHLLHASNLYRVFGTRKRAEAADLIKDDVLSALGERIWLVTLCREQEDLHILREHFVRFRAEAELDDLGVDE